MKRKYIILFIFLSLLILLCIISAVIIVFVVKKSKETKSDTDVNSQEDREQVEEISETDLYPDLENLMGKSLDEVENLYPEGEEIKSNTTWGSVYTSYELENELYVLSVDGKDTGIIDSTILAVKKFDNCVSDESILDFVDEVFPYGGFDPSLKGYADNPGIWQGAVSYYEYKEGFVLGLQCYRTPQGDSFYEIYYFKNPYQ